MDQPHRSLEQKAGDLFFQGTETAGLDLNHVAVPGHPIADITAPDNFGFPSRPGIAEF
jgi:hypothetical protein